MSDQFSKEIADLAKEYYEKYSVAELEELLAKKIWEVQPKSQAATRGGSEFWKTFQKRLLEEVLKNRQVLSGTIGFAVGQALNMLQGTNIDISDYKIVLSLIVAIVVRSAFDALDKSKKYD